jgi:hypothetical protein
MDRTKDLTLYELWLYCALHIQNNLGFDYSEIRIKFNSIIFSILEVR